jgi:hypothetical protein
VSPVVNTAPPQNIVLFLEHSHFKYHASRDLKKKDIFFNKVGDFQRQPGLKVGLARCQQR